MSDEANLIKHISTILSSQQSFSINFHQVEQSDDNYIFLLVDKGKENFIQIHDAVYTGILEPFLRKDFSYHPHLTIAQVTSESNGDVMVGEAKNLLMDKTYEVSALKLMKIEDTNRPRLEIKDFKLLT